MKKKLLFIPLLALGFLASCNNSTPTKHHFDVVCTNCTANSESSLSLDVNENEYATFNLLPNENYLLPVDIKVTSGNAVLTKNIDYIYSLSEDRLTGKVIIKSTDATDIHIEAGEQGYLYIGNNKISKSGDYSKYDLQIQGDDEAGFIVYDYKTNTLTLSNARIAAEKVNLKELKYSKEEIELVNTLIDVTNTDIKDDYSFICCLSDINQKHILTYLNELYHKDYTDRFNLLHKYMISINELKIDGNILQEFGYKDKQIKQIKNELLDLVHQQKLNNTPSALIKYLKKL